MDQASAILTVDLGAIAANWRLLAARAAPAECACVVKADAYGLGLERVAPVLASAGCRTFFVALLEEGLRLRMLLASATIFVLDGPVAGPDPLYAGRAPTGAADEPPRLRGLPPASGQRAPACPLR